MRIAKVKLGPPPPRFAALITTAAVAAAALVFGATPAEAQVGPVVGCGERSAMIKHLGKKYGETRRGAGLQSSSSVMELFVSDSGSWTLLLTTPNGETCPIAAGEAWHEEQGGPSMPSNATPPRSEKPV